MTTTHACNGRGADCGPDCLRPDGEPTRYRAKVRYCEHGYCGKRPPDCWKCSARYGYATPEHLGTGHAVTTAPVGEDERAQLHAALHSLHLPRERSTDGHLHNGRW